MTGEGWYGIGNKLKHFKVEFVRVGEKFKLFSFSTVAFIVLHQGEIKLILI